MLFALFLWKYIAHYDVLTILGNRMGSHHFITTTTGEFYKP